MSRSAAFAERFDALGIWWPKGNGDAMREAAKAWRTMADAIDDITAVIDRAARSVGESYQGTAADAFNAHWPRYSAADGYLPTTAADCRRLAAALDDFGGDIDTADEVLVNLTEQALEAQRVPAGQIDPAAYDQWLRESSHTLAAHVGGQAVARTEGLATIGDLAASAEPTNRDAVDPLKIAWAHPGTPEDLSALGSEAVDFGAGEGDLSELDDLETDGTGGQSGGGGGGGGGGGAGGGGFAGGGAGDFSLPDFVPPPTGDEGAGADDGGGFDLGAAAGAGAAGAAGAAAAAAARSGRLPFFPFMPMTGGGGDNESDEPRRRRPRRRPS